MNLKVMIIDDDEIVVLIHKTYLKKCGISPDPITFLNGEEALQYIQAHGGTDTQFLVLLDLNMPVMDGWSFMEELSHKSLSTQVYVVMITSSLSKADRERAKSFSNTIDFLVKPLDISSYEGIRLLPELTSYF
jgi:CheY-like chemotaxis protein